MEIERKWMVRGWPEWMQPCREYEMEQGYLSTHPTVRVRREAQRGGPEELVLCIKGGGGLAREELEMSISRDYYEGIKRIIGLPLIPKERRDYDLPDGLRLEVSLVDKGAATEFMYAEVEFDTVQQAVLWKPEGALAEYLSEEVTGQPGQSMGEYWRVTRENKK